MLQCCVVVGSVHTVLPWLQFRYWVFSLFPGDMCCTSVQRQQWVTIFTCAVWHLSSSVMKKPSCPTLPRSSRVFHIKYWVHLLSTYYYCCYWDLFILEPQEPLLECPWCINTSSQSDQTFLRTSLVLETMMQMKYGGVLHQHAPLYPVLSCFTQESALFMDQASSILRTLSRVVSSFSDEQQQLAARRMLQKTHRPQHISTSLRKHDSVTHNGPVTSNKQFNILPLVSLEAQLLFLLLPIILKK